MGLVDIIAGHKNEVFKINEELSKKRIDICKQCPLYKNVLGGVCDSSKYINPETEETSTIPLYGWIRGCGCIVSKRARFENNKCVIGKW